MEKIKSLFVFNKKLYAIDETNSFFLHENVNKEWVKSSNFPVIDPNSMLLSYKSSLLIEISTSNVVFYEIKDMVKSILTKHFHRGINFYDTFIADDFLCLCLNDEAYLITDLKSLISAKFSSTFLLLNANESNLIEWKNNTKEVLIKDIYSKEVTIKIEDLYTNPVNLTEKNITVEKAVKRFNSREYILQSDYDFLYKIDLDHLSNPISKLRIKNTFLGDTISLESGDYHITNQYIYKIDWTLQKAHQVLNWAEITECSNFPGITILQVYEDIIVFLGTTVGLVVFYSYSSNRIVSFSYLNKEFYTNTQSLLYENKIYLIDSSGILHDVVLPLN